MSATKRKTILILFGGCSTEYEVSLQSACAVLEHLDPARFQALPVGITRDGRWLRYRGARAALAEDRWQREDCIPCTLALDRGARELVWLDGSGKREAFDAAFPVLHGKNGEDGTVQGALELAAKRAEKKKKKTLTYEEDGQTVTREVTGAEANKLRLELARKRDAELHKDERTTPLQQ